jgi:hypothetical protein
VRCEFTGSLCLFEFAICHLSFVIYLRLLLMKPAFFLAPAGRGQGLTNVALGMVVALDRRGVRVSFYKPISEDRGVESRPERSTHFFAGRDDIGAARPDSTSRGNKTYLERSSR